MAGLQRLGICAIGIAAALLSSAVEARAQGGSPAAIAALNSLPIKGRAPKTGYARARFGTGWSRNAESGCDTRNTILQRDLTSHYNGEGANDCTVLSGLLLDPYSGASIVFQRGIASSDVQIDHVVSLSNAWQTGAFRWTDSKRALFYSDPLNLLAVAGYLNSQKGDGDAATWLPPRRAYRCEFVARQIAVKSKYELWMTAPEAKAMQDILAKCPGQLLPR